MSSENQSSRRLAAILFADIQGYTALMQEDEQAATVLLRKFQSSLEEHIPKYDGEIVNFYGDGAFCTFPNPLTAVKCAIDLQSRFDTDPIVPVRIGIHSGTVVIEGNKAFGDNVNIASRIESMGIPGSILVSKKVRDELKNQKNLALKSLGKFEFKNVQEQIEVYALINEGLSVPDKKKIQGKFKSAKKSSNKVIAAVISTAAIILVALYFTQWKSQTLPQEILDERIAVLPFENKTNNPEYDILGDMAADWIIEGLMNLEDIKVVSFKNIKSNAQFASINNESGSLDKFQQLTGAGKIIEGNFYELDNQLIFQSKLLDTKTGEVDKVFPKIQGKTDAISSIVDDLKDNILGFYAFNSDKNSMIFLDNPPNYEAYKISVKGDELFASDQERARNFYNQAIQLDSSFFLPYMNILTTYGNSGNYRAADSVLQIMEKRLTNLTPFEQINMDWCRAMVKRDIYEMTRAVRKQFEKDPKNHMYNYLTGYYEANINKPEAAVEVFQEIDTAAMDDILSINVESWWNEVYAHCLIRLGRYEAAEEILKLVPDEFVSRDDHRLLAQIFVMTDNEDKLQKLINDIEQSGKSPGYVATIYNAASIAYNLKGSPEEQQIWGNRAVKYLEGQPESSLVNDFRLGESYYHAGEYQKAISLFRKLARTRESGSVYGVGLWHYLSRLGTIHARLGDKKSAMAILEELKQVDDPTPSGRYTYAAARIKAQLRDSDGAIADMKKALNEGFVNEYAEFRYGEDVEFEPLRGIPEFDGFVLQKD